MRATRVSERGTQMKLADLMMEAKQNIGAKGVYGEPYEKNGVTIIPAARIMGGVGGGEGPAGAPGPGGTTDLDGTPSTATGAGYGVSGHATGAFVIKGNDVSWVPAVDVNRLMFGFQIVAIVFFLTLRSIAKTRSNMAQKQSA